MNPPLRTAFRRALDKAVHFVGLDADVLHTLVFRSWSILAGAAMLVLVPAYLNGVEQGYYYTFASLLTLQIFFDLGMNQVILQLVSHEVARPDHAGDARLAALIILLRQWYGVAALAFFVLVSAGGAWFLAQQHALPPAAWLGPWAALTLATAANLYLSAMLAVIEGSGDVANVARLRFRQSVLGYFASWFALAAGAGLWATPLLPIACVASSTWWLQTHTHARLVREARKGISSDMQHVVSWRHEVFPLQWRLALSWISGYFIFQLLTPLAFARHGAVEAGRLGITLAMFNAVLTAGMSWVNAKFPAMATHLARRERSQANALFRAVAKRAIGFNALGSGSVLIALAGVAEFAPAVAQRFAPLPVIGCLALATLANSFVYAAAAYLRAHKEEPMLWISVVTGIVMAVAVDAGSKAGVLPMMALYMAVTLLVPLPWTFVLFRRYFRRPAR